LPRQLFCCGIFIKKDQNTLVVGHLERGVIESASPTGSIVVEGHELHEEDIRLMYTFDQASGGTAQFEAHSDTQVFSVP
jgi:isoleucyl-tRNA synthetase